MGLETSGALFPEQGREKEEPVIRYKIVRHAERTPSGQLTPDGVQDSNRKGEKLKGSAEVVKGYSSTEETDRAFQTLETISGAATGEGEQARATRRRPGLFYDVAGPLASRVKEYTKLINQAVKKDHPDFDPDSKDPKWGKIRKEYQPAALKGIIAKDSQLVHIFSMGVAHQLADMRQIASRYVGSRNQKAASGRGQEIKKDLVLMEGTHGGMLESLLKKALIRVDKDGQEKRGFAAFTDVQGNPELEEALGGIFKPSESFDIVEKVGRAKQSRLPIEFENSARFPGEKCFLDLAIVEDLADQFNVYFQKLQAWQKDNSLAGELTSSLDSLMEDFVKKYPETGG